MAALTGRAVRVKVKQAKPRAPGRVPARRGCWPSEVSIATTIHVSGETLEILSNVALARELASVAKASHGIKVKPRDRDRSVAAVIEGLIEQNRPALAAEGEGMKVKRRRHRAAEKRRQEKAKAKVREKQRRQPA